MRAIRRFSGSSSFWVGALFTFLLSLSVYFAAYFLIVSSDNTLLRESRAAIKAQTNTLVAISQQQGINGLVTYLNDIEPKNNDYIYAISDQNGNLVEGNIKQWPELTLNLDFREFHEFKIPHEHLAMDLHTGGPVSENHDFLTLITTLDNQYQLLVARDVDDLQVAQYLGKTFGWVMVLILIVISLTSFLVGYFVFDRINRMASKAGDIISTGNLSTRLQVDSNWDDLSRLAIVLNEMLDEIEGLVEGIKSVSDNIAHDLRTPLTRLRGKISHVSDDITRDSLLHEVDNLLSIFNSLLRIAQIESEKQKQAFCKVDLNLVMEDVVELYAPLAEAKDIELSFKAAPCCVHGDKDLLFQAFANLLDNSIKFCQASSKIHFSMEIQNQQALVRICDSGDGVPEQEIEKITRRFHRVETSRTTSGNGLGLALVAAVIKLHQGKIDFHNNYLKDDVNGFCCVCQIAICAP